MTLPETIEVHLSEKNKIDFKLKNTLTNDFTFFASLSEQIDYSIENLNVVESSVNPYDIEITPNIFYVQFINLRDNRINAGTVIANAMFGKMNPQKFLVVVYGNENELDFLYSSDCFQYFKR